MSGTALLRLLGRIGVVCVALVALSLIGVQYARVIGRNLALAHELRDVERDTLALKAKRAQQERDIRRLTDAHGAIPEIHDRLHLVGDREAIIYLKRGHSPSASEQRRGTESVPELRRGTESVPELRRGTESVPELRRGTDL
jgi:hypothetical protein